VYRNGMKVHEVFNPPRGRGGGGLRRIRPGYRNFMNFENGMIISFVFVRERVRS